jgi:hypothetical protein
MDTTGKSIMGSARPSIFSMLVWVYWDLAKALRMAWRPALIATVILSVGIIAALAVPHRLTYDPIGQLSARQIVLIGLCFLLTPYLMTIHRGLLLGEWTTRYSLLQPGPRYQLYFGWLVMCVLLLGLPSYIYELTAPRGPVYYDASHPYTSYRSPIVGAVRTAAWLGFQYSLVLFPAVAVDARGATWQNAFGDTRRHVWFVLAVTILSFIPIVLLSAAMAPLLRSVPRDPVGMIASLLLLGAMSLVWLTLGAVVASRLYQVIGDRLNTPA